MLVLYWPSVATQHAKQTRYGVRDYGHVGHTPLNRNAYTMPLRLYLCSWGATLYPGCQQGNEN